MLGTLLNRRFKIIQVLGSGGFGQTYVAEDTLQPANAKCVIKQFKPARQDEDFLHVARRLFRTEVETLRSLGIHDQIPALIADFEENQEFFLAQEYIEGLALSDELAAVAHLDEATVTALLRDVLNVLEFVHRNQVIHRDIKPGNLIRRSRDGKFVLIDFGAVKAIQTQLTTAPEFSNLTVGIGTQGYGPSEQMMGKPRYSSDLYALGMTAIQALTGLQPFQLPTHPDTGEVIWQDQAQVSPKLAAILTKMTRYHFSDRFQSAREILQALDQAATILIDHTQLPHPHPFDRETHLLTAESGPADPVHQRATHILPRFRWVSVIGIASALTTGLLLGLRQLGWLQPLELAAFDRMVQMSPSLGPDPRLLIVGITDADIQSQKQFPIADQTLAQVIKRLQVDRPRAIGLDLLRAVPQGQGHTDFLAALNAPNVIAITNLGSPVIPAPPGVPFNRVGFNDFVLDPSDVVRRNLMFADSTLNGNTTTFYSFSLRLALAYLAADHIRLQAQSDPPDAVQLGKAQIMPLESTAGGYQAIDARGYQILLRYRGREVARQVSLTDVLTGQIKPEWVRDKLVLIGTTASSGKDLFSTPYSSGSDDTPRMPGVLLHAQMASQLVDAAMDGHALIWIWPDWLEALWIAMWATIGSLLAWYIRRPLVLGVSGTALLITLVGICFGFFVHLGWVPVVAPALAATLAGGIVVTYQAYGAPRSLK